MAGGDYCRQGATVCYVQPLKVDQKQFESGMMLLTLQQLFKKLMIESYDDVHSSFKVKINGANEVPMGCAGRKEQ